MEAVRTSETSVDNSEQEVVNLAFLSFADRLMETRNYEAETIKHVTLVALSR
jgi:hypothetical protein